jgi:tetratricopeptide (TPR) repeat protein
MSSDAESSNVVPFGRRHPDPSRIAEFAATARRLQREREEAAFVDALLDETPSSQWPLLAANRAWQTSGVLEALGNRIASILDRDPPEALELAVLETLIADALANDSYPAVVVAQLRAHAWKDRGQALAYLSRYEEALAALDRAEEFIAHFGSLAHDVAIVRFVRATTLQEVGRYDESFTLLHECRIVFRDYGDGRRYFLCRLAEGVLLHRLKRYAAAREQYLLLLAGMNEDVDPVDVACLHNVIGHCSVDLRDFDNAEVHLERAAAMFRELGQPLQAAKAENGRGKLFLARGELARGIAHLHAVRQEFLAAGMVEHAGICGIDIVEALLNRRAAAAAETLARTLVLEFTAAGLNGRAISALAYLRDAIIARRASPAVAMQVREYIVSLRRCPERDFVATA